MRKNYQINFDLNIFLENISLRKQYFKNLNNKSLLLSYIKKNNYKFLNSRLYQKIKFINTKNQLALYIIDIQFSRSNTLLHVMDFSGKLKFFYSAGSFGQIGKNKKSRYIVFRDLYRVLVSKLKLLQGKPVILHLKNVGFNKFWIVKKLKKRFFIINVKNFNSYPYNGCRKRKIRRKKFKKRNEEMAEGFKAADCKSVEFSHHRFESCFLLNKSALEI